MAGNIGYFMGGMAKGLTFGANLGMQITQIRWQKKKQKELDDMTKKMNDAWNSIGQELITLAEDGQLSEDDKLKIYTLTIAAPYEMQGVMQNLRSSLAQFKTDDFDKQMEMVKTFYDYAEGMDKKDIGGLYETFRGYITNPHALTLFEVADKKLRHEVEVAKEEEPWKRAATLPSEMRVPFLKQEGVEIPEVEPPTKAPTAAQQKINWANEAYQKGLRGETGGITFEQLERFYGVDIPTKEATGLKKRVNDIISEGNKAGISKDKISTAIENEIIGKPSGVTTTPPTFKSLQDVKEAFSKVKTKAEYDEAMASWNASKEAKTSGWTPPAFEDSLTDLIKEVESAFWADYVNKEGKLKDKDESELYNQRVQQYLLLIEEARNAGIDVSQFQAFIPYKETYWGRGNPLVTSESW